MKYYLEAIQAKPPSSTEVLILAGTHKLIRKPLKIFAFYPKSCIHGIFTVEFLGDKYPNQNNVTLSDREKLHIQRKQAELDQKLSIFRNYFIPLIVPIYLKNWTESYKLYIFTFQDIRQL